MKCFFPLRPKFPTSGVSYRCGQILVLLSLQSYPAPSPLAQEYNSLGDPGGRPEQAGLIFGRSSEEKKLRNTGLASIGLWGNLS